MKNVLLIFLLSLSLNLAGQVPKTINFQGYLTDQSSTAIDGTRDMKFSLYDAVTGGTELWFEDKAGVTITKGLYNVILGDTKPVDLPFDKIYFLQVKVGTEVLLPRITLTSNAYSISSINASNITSGTLNGALVGSGINAANITTGTLTGSFVGTGINASNITTNNLAVGNGGTGANTASGARTNLGLGTLSTLSSVTSTEITDGTILNTDINATAAIADSKLATISTAGKVSNSATTATNANTASTIVARDASGNFSAGTITATLNGNASTVTTNANLTGDVTSSGNTTSIASGVIVNADINSSAAIADTKLATISTAGKVSGDAITSGTIGGSTAINTSGTITSSSYVGATGGLHVGNTTAPATSGNLEVDGYTKLGANAPIIKILKLTGTTDPTQGNEVSVAHGLTVSKILSVTALVESTAGTNYIPPGFKFSGGFEYYVYLLGVNVKVSTTGANSANVVSKPFKILITYEQ